MFRSSQKPIVFLASLGPALWLAYRAFNGMLDANPVEDLLLATGLWAFRFLLISLAVTPIRRLTGWNGVIKFRRMFGLFAFFYASLHLSIYVVLDQGLEVGFILADVAKRRFITAGVVAFLLVTPLAVTSTRGWIRRLGRRWHLLHRLAYVGAAAAALHFIWKVKVVVGEPMYYAAALGILLGFRALWRAREALLTGRKGGGEELLNLKKILPSSPPPSQRPHFVRRFRLDCATRPQPPQT
jgi:methionine sulfoxide reductase heme-binding subunit